MKKKDLARESPQSKDVRINHNLQDQVVANIVKSENDNEEDQN